ncbi:MAG: hypothetical protein K5896_11125 [Prevotella sp.]|nr:hypothetical protein [Prevotella sp.]
MKAFHAYFTYSDVSNSRFTLTFTDNETEGISESCYNNDSPDKVYDLQGRRVQEGQLKQGLYIRNGKKTIIR